jgi:hypothetical protein
MCDSAPNPISSIGELTSWDEPFGVFGFMSALLQISNIVPQLKYHLDIYIYIRNTCKIYSLF